MAAHGRHFTAALCPTPPPHYCSLASHRTALGAGIFGLWGLAYLGGVQYCLYSFVFPRAFPGAVKFIEAPLRAKLRDTQGMLTVAKQVFFDQFIHHPFVLFPTFYLVKGAVESDSPTESLAKCKANWT